jgi:hypothetical protein
VRRVGIALAALLAAAPAAAHHVGAYVPRDNDVSASFKQVKYAMQERKFAVAARLYEAGPLRAALRARAASLPRGLDESIRAALAAGDGAEAERGLMVFFAALARDLAVEADRQLADAQLPAQARVAASGKFVEAIWRYYNLVDFAVSQRHPTLATAVRLAVDDAEGLARRAAAPPAPETLREPFRRIARALTGVIEATSTSARRHS